jgi:hypothetical protein
MRCDPRRIVRGMLKGRLLAESLRVGHDVRVPDLTVVRIGRHDVSESTTPFESGSEAAARGAGGASSRQPGVWTFIDFEAPAERADELAQALAGALLAENGWWADFTVDGDRVIVFAGKVFRYRIGDREARDEAIDHGLALGTPRHQLDLPR